MLELKKKKKKRSKPRQEMTILPTTDIVKKEI